MSDGLTRLRIGISIVFVITLLILLFQLCYVLWRRSLHRRQHRTGESDSTVTTGSTPYYSKELLYFLCWKNQARIEPVFRSSTTNNNEAAESNDHDQLDVSKLHELYGLFTIKEDKEEFEYISDHHGNHGDGDQSVSSSEKSCEDEDDVHGEVDSMVTIVIHGEEEAESTPYSTPCNSPPYYTPSPSPSHGYDRDDVDDEIDDQLVK